MKKIFFILISSLFLMAFDNQVCTQYILEKDEVYDCGDTVMIKGSENKDTLYFERAVINKQQILDQVERQHELSIEAKKIEVLARLNEFSATKVYANAYASNHVRDNKTEITQTNTNTANA